VLQASFDGIVLEYEDLGQGEPVVFILGSLIADSFSTPIRESSLKTLQAHNVPPSRLCSKQPAPWSLSISEQAADCLGLLRFLDVQRVHVVGHSFGGVVALQRTLGFPGLVHSLALLEPALTLGASAESYRESLAQAINGYSSSASASVVHGMMAARWPRYNQRLDEALPGAIDQALASADTVFKVELPGLLQWDCFGEDQAGTISQPVLSVLGADSESYGHSSARFTAQSCNGSPMQRALSCLAPRTSCR
jgi:pimeloyl-ACP methyl ester carboxylesterase